MGGVDSKEDPCQKSACAIQKCLAGQLSNLSLLSHGLVVISVLHASCQ